jgi:hypothetical protein
MEKPDNSKKVIYVDFSNPQSEREEKTSGDFAEEKNLDAAGKKETATDEVVAMVQKLTKLRNLINSVPVNTTTYGDHYVRILEMKKADRIQTIKDATEQKVRMNPMYYRALTDLVPINDVVQSVLDERNK